MTTSLFRQEAIDAQRAKIWGEVTFKIPLSLTLITGFLMLCVTGIGAFVATGTYARKEHVPGFLTANLGVANIVAARPGIISAVHVKEGQLVDKDAPLISVTVEQSSEGGAGVDSSTLATLRQQRRRLDEQIGLEHHRTEVEAQRLEAEITALTGELDTIDRQRKVQAQRSAIAQDQSASSETLAKQGVLSQSEFKKRQDVYLSVQAAQLDFERLFGEKQKELSLLRNDLAQLPIGSEQRISQLQASIDDADMRIRQTDVQRAYLITAPKAGRVSALQAWVGKTAEPNIPQMSIVPEGDTLTAELFVPMRAIGFVAPGQSVHLSYTSFPYQQFGFADGTVDTVSHTLLRPDQSVGPLTFGAPAYRVSVTLRRQTIAAYGKDVPLQADMQLDADIIFDRRSLYAWLFDPLLSSWRRPG